MNQIDSRDMAVYAAMIADERKGNDVIVIDFEGQSVLYDYVIITSALSTRETKAIARAVDERLKDFKPDRRIVQGMDSGLWILLDYGSVVVHIFAEQDRESFGRGLRPLSPERQENAGNYRAFYDLEKLWRDIPRYDYKADPNYPAFRQQYMPAAPSRPVQPEE